MTDPLRALADAPDVCKCGCAKEWRECWNCGGEGLTDHDCGEDCCCCLNPEPNVECDICDGEGEYKVCPICFPEDNDYGF